MGIPAIDRVMADATGGLIAKGIKVKGEITGAGRLVIEGQVDGLVNIDDVTVTPGGVMNADVDASVVTVHGQVAGNIAASERVEVKATATVQGDIRAPSIVIEEGAAFRGHVHMDVDVREES